MASISPPTFNSTQLKPGKFYCLEDEGDQLTEVDDNTRGHTQDSVLLVRPCIIDKRAFSYHSIQPFLEQFRRRNIHIIIAAIDPVNHADSLKAINQQAARIGSIGEILLGHGYSDSIDLGRRLYSKDFKYAFLPTIKPFFVVFCGCNTGQDLVRSISNLYYDRNITFFAPMNMIYVKDAFFYTYDEESKNGKTIQKHEFYFGDESKEILLNDKIREFIRNSTGKYCNGQRLTLVSTTDLSQKILDATDEDKIFKELTKLKKSDLLKADEINLTPFHYLISKGYLKTIQAILAQLNDADREQLLNNSGLKNYSPLMMAIQANKPEVIDFFLGQELVDRDATDEYGNTALYWAVKLGDLSLIQRLIDNVADLEGRKYLERTALHWATEIGNLEVVKMLVKAGADVNGQNLCKITPLMLAILNKQTYIFDFLLTTCSNPNATFKLDLELKDVSGYTALHIAVYCNDLVSVKKLVQADASLKVSNINGDTPIKLARKMGHDEIANFLHESTISSPPEIALDVDSFSEKKLNQTEHLKNASEGSDYSTPSIAPH